MADDVQMQMPEVRTSPYNAPMNSQGSAMILLTNPEDELRQLELTLRNEREDYQGKTQVIGEPLMNELGINAMLGSTRAIVNQVTILSNVDIDEVERLMVYFAESLAKDLMVNKVKYGIKTPSTRDKIYSSVILVAYICIKRAKDGDDKRFWGKVVQEINSSANVPQQKKGLMDKIFGWGGRK